MVKDSVTISGTATLYVVGLSALTASDRCRVGFTTVLRVTNVMGLSAGILYAEQSRNTIQVSAHKRRDK